jgi:dihydropteroate synthase
MTIYYRPIPCCDIARPLDALPLAGGWSWFRQVEKLERGQHPEIIAAHDIPTDILQRLCGRREKIVGISFKRPSVMGILNVTPDSFSDGGQFQGTKDVLQAACAMVEAGADILDIGGESTRPGADTVPDEVETARVVPAIAAIRRAGLSTPISIDTRKAAVAQSALQSGAQLINDVSGFTYDDDLVRIARDTKAPICVMHAQGDPASMQENPFYDDVLLDVYDFLETQVTWLESQGITRSNIIIDPGIGFGKTLEHNLALLNRISLFHGLGVPILLGVSRKGFIGRIGKAPKAKARMPGSVAVALAAVAQGVQMLRVHDVAQTTQALALWQVAILGDINNE